MSHPNTGSQTSNDLRKKEIVVLSQNLDTILTSIAKELLMIIADYVIIFDISFMPLKQQFCMNVVAHECLYKNSAADMIIANALSDDGFRLISGKIAGVCDDCIIPQIVAKHPLSVSVLNWSVHVTFRNSSPFNRVIFGFDDCNYRRIFGISNSYKYDVIPKSVIIEFSVHLEDKTISVTGGGMETSIIHFNVGDLENMKPYIYFQSWKNPVTIDLRSSLHSIPGE